MVEFGIIAAFLKSSLINQIIFIGLVLISIYSWGIVFAKLTWLKVANRSLREIEGIVNSTQGYISLKVLIGAKAHNIYNEVLKDVFNSQNYSAKMDAIDSKHNSKLDFLASASSIAPFIGLLGTVIGVISSFNAIGISKSASLAVIAPGIAEALYATALGLFVAIPALWFYNYFVTKFSDLEYRQEEVISTLKLKSASATAAVNADKHIAIINADTHTAAVKADKHIASSKSKIVLEAKNTKDKLDIENDDNNSNVIDRIMLSASKANSSKPNKGEANED